LVAAGAVEHLLTQGEDRLRCGEAVHRHQEQRVQVHAQLALQRRGQLELPHPVEHPHLFQGVDLMVLQGQDGRVQLGERFQIIVGRVKDAA
jgi:hypothetical protein